jgi:hypothetical protein
MYLDVQQKLIFEVSSVSSDVRNEGRYLDKQSDPLRDIPLVVYMQTPRRIIGKTDIILKSST